MTETQQRRTKRRYAHELYPHPDEWEVRPLEVEVPYLLARAAGFDVEGTNWTAATPREIGDRFGLHLLQARTAFLADALLQGMAGQDAWTWAAQRCDGDSVAEFVWERCAAYGVDIDQIKPYPCGGAPSRHAHISEPNARGWHEVTYVAGSEDDCLDCTEPITDDPRHVADLVEQAVI